MSKIKDYLTGLSEAGKKAVLGDWKVERDIQRGLLQSRMPDNMDDNSGYEPMIIRFERD